MINRSFLVTGGSGFLGSALVRRLVQEGARVRVLDNHWRGRPRRLADVADHIELVTGDIRDAECVGRAMEGIDCVAHLGAINGTRYFYEEPELVIDVAIRGTLNVIDACRRHGVRDLVVASSSEAYQSPELIPTPENVPLVVPDILNPRYSYGGSKLAAELIAFNYGRTGFDRVVVFRPHNVYGPDMGFEHVIPELTVPAARSGSVSHQGRWPAYPGVHSCRRFYRWSFCRDRQGTTSQCLSHRQSRRGQRRDAGAHDIRAVRARRGVRA
jgi:UDP-glucose 4-epimerase